MKDQLWDPCPICEGTNSLALEFTPSAVRVACGQHPVRGPWIDIDPSHADKPLREEDGLAAVSAWNDYLKGRL